MHHGMGGAACPTCGCGGHGPEIKGMGCGIKSIFMTLPWKVMMHAEELGLSEDQVEALRKRYAEARKQMIQIGSQIKINMIDVHDAVMREEIDMPCAEAKIREIGKLKSELFLGMIQAMNHMRHIPSPEQRKKIREMLMSWLKKGGMGMEESEPCEEHEE